jgi:hypothetical protein
MGSTSSRWRGRLSARAALIVATAGGVSALVAEAAAPAAATGCTTHQCDPSTVEFDGGRVVGDIYETNDWDEDWIPYPGQVTIHVKFPRTMPRAPLSVDSYVGTGPNPNGGPKFEAGQSWAPSAGGLSILFFLDQTGFFVSNTTCAYYYARFVVHFAPPTFTLFGGQGPLPDGGTGLLADTWTWDGTGWNAQNPSTPPVPLTGANMVTVNGATFLIDGVDQSGAYHGDVWQWTGANWNQVFLTPPEGGQLVFPSPRAEAAAAVLENRIVLFGGIEPSADGGPPGPVDDGTWTWDGNANESWIQIAPSRSPGARSGAAMAALHGSVVLFGGMAGGTPLGDTWTWDGSTWTQQQVPGPSARYHAAMASLDGRVVLFGGNDGSNDLGDTWLWDGASWTQASGPGSPPAARSGAACGTVGNTLILFGGTANGTPLGDTWTWDGQGWTPQGAAGPSARSGAAASGP